MMPYDNAPTSAGAAGAEVAPHIANQQSSRDWRGPIYIAPAMALIAFVLIAPSFYGLYYSFHDIKFLKAGSFVGFDNFYYMVTDPDFIPLIIRSAIFAALSVALTVGLAIPLAVWINSIPGFMGLFVQTIVILPWVLSSLIGALLFQWVFVVDFGWTGHLVSLFGFTGYQPLGNPVGAMIVLILFSTWRTLGFAMLLILAGLKSIPEELHEAAYVDGSSSWQTLRYITLPLLTTSIMITTIVLTVSNLNNVEGPLVVTGGGPAGATNILPLAIYTMAFGQFNFNAAIPLGIGMFAGNILLALGYVRLVRRDYEAV